MGQLTDDVLDQFLLAAGQPVVVGIVEDGEAVLAVVHVAGQVRLARAGAGQARGDQAGHHRLLWTLGPHTFSERWRLMTVQPRASLESALNLLKVRFNNPIGFKRCASEHYNQFRTDLVSLSAEMQN